MRKKIPTITRPDPAYAASLRPEGEKDPGRKEADREETVLMPMSMTADVADEDQAPAPSRPSVSSPQPSPETTAEIITAPTASPPRGPTHSGHPQDRYPGERAGTAGRSPYRLRRRPRPCHPGRSAPCREDLAARARVRPTIRRAENADHRMARAHFTGRRCQCADFHPARP